MEALLTDFGLDLMTQDYAATTINSYVDLVRRFLRLHPDPLATIRSNHIRAYLINLLNTPARHKATAITPSSVDVNRKALKCFFNWARTRRLIRHDPLAGITRIRHHDRQVMAPDDGTVIAVLEAAKHMTGTRELDARNVAMFTLALDCGLRLNELLAMTVADVWDGVKLRPDFVVRGRKQRRDRAAALNEDSRFALTEYLRLRRAAGTEPRLFVTRDGLPLERAACRNILWRACDVAHIPRFGWHQFRRYFGTAMADLAEQGVIAEQDAKLVGGFSERTWPVYSRRNASIRAVSAHRKASPLKRMRAA